LSKERETLDKVLLCLTKVSGIFPYRVR
jgi:hypothetical protein